MNDPVLKKFLAWWPFLVLGTLAVIFALMLTFSRKAPVIGSLDPSMAAPGQMVVLSGDYFGRTAREGSLSLAGEIPPPSLIQTWSDQKIVFVVPEDAASGLVTVSNSQGTSTGVLFTNTETIPTVLKNASEPGSPLVMAVMPSQPVAGQTVYVTGRGFGLGDEKVSVQLDAGGGAVLTVSPGDTLNWTNRSIAFRWPSGAGAATKLTVVTPRGVSLPVHLDASGPVVFSDPRTITVELRAKVSVPEKASLTLWGPVPQPSSGTVWSLVSADPAPLALPGSLAFRWPSGVSGDLHVDYRLTLTTFSRTWNGWSAGAVPVNLDVPTPDGPVAWWKDANTALKNLTAKWGLATPDPWLRIQRLQTGLAGNLQFRVAERSGPGLSGDPNALLASGKLDSTDAAALAVFLAAQVGVPGRLVSGLWLRPDEQVFPRTWAEVWIAGAGWVAWDPVDGNPGSLDNRHFAFETSTMAPTRLQPRSKTFGPVEPVGLGLSSGEFTGSVPSVRWELARVDK